MASTFRKRPRSPLAEPWGRMRVLNQIFRIRARGHFQQLLNSQFSCPASTCQHQSPRRRRYGQTLYGTATRSQMHRGDSKDFSPSNAWNDSKSAVLRQLPQPPENTNSAPRLQTRCGIHLIQCKLYSTTQFSILSPFTCEKCCVLLVTKIASIDFAAAAISISNAPIGVPPDSNCARTSA